MRILRVFPRRTSHTPTDALAFIGNPPLQRPEADEVHVSVAFTWDVPAAERLAAAWGQYYPVVRMGGPAWGSHLDGFVPGRYVREGVVFTSRGCNNRCPWCLVPKREGTLTLIEDFAEGWIINDNNFLQCPPSHRQRVYRMLTQQKQPALFAGGLEAALVTDEIARELCGLRINQVFLAADRDAALGPLERALEKLRPLGRAKLRVYTLCAFGGQTIDQAEVRLRRIWELGAMPFAMLYQPPDQYIQYSREWRALQKRWTRPAAMKAHLRGESPGKRVERDERQAALF